MDTVSLLVVWPAITLPVGQGKPSPWTRTEAIKAAGVSTLCVIPRLTVWVLDDGMDDPVLWRDLDLEFDSETWDTGRFGDVYQDESFCEAMAQWAKDVGFSDAFGAPDFTESGMQTSDTVSMAFPTVRTTRWFDAWGSAHEALAWLAHAKAQGWAVTCPVLEDQHSPPGSNHPATTNKGARRATRSLWNSSSLPT